MNEHMNKYVNGKKRLLKRGKANRECKKGIRMHTVKRKWILSTNREGN